MPETEFQSPRSGKFESNVRNAYITSKDFLMKFQSPKSEKFESNDIMDASILNNQMFQSPRSGKFESNKAWELLEDYVSNETFQSPRSGKFESNPLTMS